MSDESAELTALRHAAGIRPSSPSTSRADLLTDLVRHGMQHCAWREDLLSLIAAFAAFQSGMDCRLALFQHRTWPLIDDLRSARPFERGVDSVAAIALFIAATIEQDAR